MQNLQETFSTAFDGQRLLHPIYLEANQSYRLTNDIVVDFDPMVPSKEDIEKDPFLRYGFFAALIMCESDIDLNLSGFTISMSPRLQMQLRFFSLIEFNNSPFPLRDGLPLCDQNQSCDWKRGRNLRVRNGKLGSVSHSCIHGNENRNVSLFQLECENFEVGGIMLNGFVGLRLTNIRCANNSKNLVANSRWSAVLQLTRQCGNVFDLPMDPFRPLLETVHEIQNDLPPFFRNSSGFIEGTVYGILLNRKGVAVRAHGSTPATEVEFGKNAQLENIYIHDIHGGVKESIAVSHRGKVLRDISGHFIDLLQVVDKKEMDILTYFQFLFARYAKESKLTSTMYVPLSYQRWFDNTFPDHEWSPGVISIPLQPEEVDTLAQLMEEDVFVRGGDGMFHVNKGIFGMKIDGVKDLSLINLSLKRVSNSGELSKTVPHGKVEFLSSNTEDTQNYTGNDAYGLLLNACEDVNVDLIRLEDIVSLHGKAFGIFAMNRSQNINIQAIEDQDTEKTFVADKPTPSFDYCSIVLQNSCSKFQISSE